MAPESKRADGYPDRFFLTAKEACPAFERAVLEAREEILISMRVFCPADPTRAADWRRLACQALSLSPAERRPYLLPHDNALAADMAQPLPGVPE